MELDASFWATVSLVLFLVLLAWLKVPAMLTGALDARSGRISRELEEAKRLREEAQELLAEYQRKRKQAEAEAGDIVSAARHEAELLTAEAQRKTEEYVARRTAMAEQKIEQAEAEAIAEVKASAVDLAIAASQRIVAAKASEKSTADSLVKQSISELKSRFN